MDATAILNITLCTRRQSDFWAWNYDPKGMFSIRSAYRMMINTKINKENYYEGNPGSSNSDSLTKGWCSLWKTLVSLKVRVFLWRLSQQSLLTADILEHRNMSRTSSCSVWGG
jgi:hypothetical protein